MTDCLPTVGDGDLLTTAEVAALMRTPVSTVRYWRHLGSGPRSFRLGRRVVYLRQDVQDWIIARRAAREVIASGAN
jgi:predicted DNA-binding transcriptional regulator AlpA